VFVFWAYLCERPYFFLVLGIVVSNNRFDDIEWYSVLPTASTIRYEYQSGFVWIWYVALSYQLSVLNGDRTELGRTGQMGMGFAKGNTGGYVLWWSDGYIRLLFAFVG
jgi:hypothetical protein